MEVKGMDDEKVYIDLETVYLIVTVIQDCGMKYGDNVWIKDIHTMFFKLTKCFYLTMTTWTVFI